MQGGMAEQSVVVKCMFLIKNIKQIWLQTSEVRRNGLQGDEK